nr:sugar ABC transporter ATP-binding protein [uncultured Cohaesibacter sp.]
MTENLVLELTGISKSFGVVKALNKVDFNLRKGEVHALAGENGAGKSTLMNIVDGILSPTEGEIRIDGEVVTIPSPAIGQKLGIGFVHQEIALCPDATVAENIFMAATNASKRLLMNYSALNRRAQDVLKRLCNIQPDTMVGSLSISNQQLVEIAKALTLDCKVLILDEPTAALTENEAQTLFRIVRELRDQGISIIYISHRMAEIFALCDRITVLRDGHYVSTDNVADVTPEQVVNKLVGRDVSNLFPDKQKDEEKSEDCILKVNGLNDGDRFTDISFALRKGEILGFAGLIGAGRSEIVKAICGLHPLKSGAIEVNGKAYDVRSYSHSIDRGVVYLSEDRKGEGVFLDMSIAANISALRTEQVSNGVGLINRRKERVQAGKFANQLNLKRGHIDDPVSSLSGGNQQKVAIAKMLSVNPHVIFMDEPTRGIDVGAKSEIHRLLRDLSRSGVGILVISSELPELIGLCDRVIAICEGRIGGEVTGADMTEERIIQLASGVSPETIKQ